MTTYRSNEFTMESPGPGGNRSIWTASADRVSAKESEGFHYRAVQFHSVDKAEAERERDDFMKAYSITREREEVMLSQMKQVDSLRLDNENLRAANDEQQDEARRQETEIRYLHAVNNTLRAELTTLREKLRMQVENDLLCSQLRPGGATPIMTLTDGSTIEFSAAGETWKDKAARYDRHIAALRIELTTLRDKIKSAPPPWYMQPIDKEPDSGGLYRAHFDHFDGVTWRHDAIVMGGFVLGELEARAAKMMKALTRAE